MIKPQPDDEIATFNETLDLALAAWSQGIGNHDDAAELKALFATERAARLAAEAERDRLREAISAFDVSAYVIEYEFRGDEGDYTPSLHECALLEDAISGAISAIGSAALAGQEGGK